MRQMPLHTRVAKILQRKEHGLLRSGSMITVETSTNQFKRTYPIDAFWQETIDRILDDVQQFENDQQPLTITFTYWDDYPSTIVL